MTLKHFKLFAFGFTLLLICQINAQDTYVDKHIEVSLRRIGHQILLNANDSTSLVLPIKKLNNQYKIQFDCEFGFNPEELVETVDKVVEETKIASAYILEVEKCESGEVVYGNEIDEAENENVPTCKSRDLPKACYNLVLSLKDTSYTHSSGGLSASNRYSYFTILLLMVLIGMVFFFLKKKKIADNLHLITIGEYRFDKRSAKLLHGDKKIELTTKEKDLLMLLFNAANTTVEREVLLNKVWGDEGDYVGRTLDVFISKLRKKLVADSNLKIVNTRGVGYKLVING